MEVKRKEDREGKEISILRVHTKKRWGIRSASKRKGKESGSNNGADVGNKEKETWDKLEKKDVVI